MTIFQNDVQRGRIIASVAATAIALASGTNYVYSAWAPQFAEKLHLSSTQSNIVGLFGNLGMYSVGYPIGLLVDGRGPRPAVLLGSALLLIGYFPLQQAYHAGAGSIPLLCLFSYLSGVGGCTAFAAAVKTSALNWPHNRGTATAFPLAAFGLSAFFFSLLGSIVAPGDPGAFLMLLATGTSCICLVAFFFLNVYPDNLTYQPVPGNGPSASTLRMRRPSSPEGDPATRHAVRRPDGTIEPGTSASTEPPPDPHHITTAEQEHDHHHHHRGSSQVTAAGPNLEHHETGHPGVVVLAADNLPIFSVADESTPLLLSDASDLEDAISTPSSRPSRIPSPSSLSSHTNPPVSHPNTSNHNVPTRHRSRSSKTSRESRRRRRRRRSSNIDGERALLIDIRGLELLRNPGFWLLWIIMAILAGIGLMTINNIGNDAKALWTAWDPTKDEAFLVNRQQMHVSTLSILSFAGRLLSGVGSDILVTRLHASRAWCLAVSSCLFLLAQALALVIASPHLLILVSAVSGLAYGSLFGVFPSIIAETFGVRGLSQNWGFMTMAPVVSGNVFNLFYGRTYDDHSHVVDGSRGRVCSDGLDCYKSAYWVTFAAGWFGLAMVLWTIRWQRREALKERNKGDAED